MAGVVAAALTGCSSAPAASEVTPWQSSGVVVVTGDFGEQPRVEFPSPLVPQETQCSEVIAGEGERRNAGRLVAMDVELRHGGRER